MTLHVSATMRRPLRVFHECVDFAPAGLLRKSIERIQGLIPPCWCQTCESDPPTDATI